MINRLCCTQDRTSLLLELQEAKARLEEEEHARANEKYASELKIASLTSELKEATQKLKKYGIRQKKLLGKSKTFEVDPMVRLEEVNKKMNKKITSLMFMMMIMILILVKIFQNIL